MRAMAVVPAGKSPNPATPPPATPPPIKCTSLFWRVRPVNTFTSRLDGPSITISSIFPTRSWCLLKADLSTTTRNRSYRSRTTSGSTKSSAIPAASVPSLGENTKVYALSNSAAAATSSVRSKSSSVSPGKPTMMSVVTAKSSIASRAATSFAR